MVGAWTIIRTHRSQSLVPNYNDTDLNFEYMNQFDSVGCKTDVKLNDPKLCDRTFCCCLRFYGELIVHKSRKYKSRKYNSYQVDFSLLFLSNLQYWRHVLVLYVQKARAKDKIGSSYCLRHILVLIGHFVSSENVFDCCAVICQLLRLNTPIQDSERSKRVKAFFASLSCQALKNTKMNTNTFKYHLNLAAIIKTKP